MTRSTAVGSRSGLLICLFLLAVATISGGAVAQEEAPTAANDSDVCADAVSIDRNIELCESDLDDGDAVLTIRADRTEVITLSDAGHGPGEIPTRDVRVDGDEVTVVRFPVTVTNTGEAGVTIETSDTLYLEEVSEANVLIGGPWTVQDARVVFIGAVLGTAIGAMVHVLRHKDAIAGEGPERVA